MPKSAEVIIVGAGPAGLALAARLGALGRSVLLIDKAAAPRDKVCGEGLMPLGMTALVEAGLDPAALPGQDFFGLEYRSARQQTLLDFSPGVRGRGIRRTSLIAALETAALAHPSVKLIQDEVFGPLEKEGAIRGVRGRRGAYQGEAVVAADGVHSRLAQAAGMELRRHGYRMGLRRHYRLADGKPRDRVRIGLFAPYDLYLTPVGGGVVLATTMTHIAGYEEIRRDYGQFLRGTHFGEVFREAEPASEQMGWHHPLCTYRGRTGAGGAAGFQHREMLLLGDAGGSLDPCLGMGISLALAAAGNAATAIGGMLEQPVRRTALVQGYEAAQVRLFRHYWAFDYIFRSMVASQARSELLVWGMRHWPGATDTILAAVAEGSPWRNVSLRSLIFPRKRGQEIFG